MIDLDSRFDGMELSTRLVAAEALRRGASVEVLDRSDNFIRISRDGRSHLVKQATRTGADSYIAALAMENKQVTKLLLAEAGVRAPEGRLHDSVTAALADWPRVRGQATVVKPRSTNFGEGVAILPATATEAEFAAAVHAAFALDAAVLVEDFVAGREFRFLVIGGRTRAVLHRVPANVVGDGRRTIRELVAAKNEHPFRGEGYVKPLEKIVLGEVELAFLAAAGLDPDSVPEAGRTVFLRKNSNISTGGDSIDWTDTMPAVYHRIAERAAEALGARIAGVDMIVPDPADAGPGAAYSIIELNFNPALHIHDFPETGENRHVERPVLDLLGFPEPATPAPTIAAP
jgi:glutamate--cysteine ligase